jgi:hypothetical protein
MDETQSNVSSGWDAWGQAVLGTAINAAVDRYVYGPQTLGDGGQAYGVDQNGRMYTLGQTNGQLSATIQTRAPSTISPWLIVAVAIFAVLELK